MALKWGWYSKEKLKAQDRFFDSPEAAIKDMEARHGHAVSLQRLAELGYHLALVEVEVKTLMILDNPNE